ncbi:hypothetical protein [Ligilactobacillus agilis]|uniref:hypothetical protein n=1 Tax=Ligilactobacillus agilis TaxID=1601 RepID=UPI000B8D3A25|nr:hypothetical protein [Ligilactobacillus agilis]ASR40284.1 hypothetical protein BEN83_01590 [Ligilactobacillus agilis]
MNELTEFEQANLVLMTKLAQSEQLVREVKEMQESYKRELKDAMEKYNIKSIDNDLVKVTVVPESESTTVDLKTFREKEPDEYDGLLADYPKVVKRSSYVRIKVK